MSDFPDARPTSIRNDFWLSRQQSFSPMARFPPIFILNFQDFLPILSWKAKALLDIYREKNSQNKLFVHKSARGCIIRKSNHSFFVPGMVFDWCFLVPLYCFTHYFWEISRKDWGRSSSSLSVLTSLLLLMFTHSSRSFSPDWLRKSGLREHLFTTVFSLTIGSYIRLNQSALVLTRNPWCVRSNAVINVPGFLVLSSKPINQGN